MRYRNRWCRHTSHCGLLILTLALLLVLASGSTMLAQSYPTLDFLEEKLSLKPNNTNKFIQRFTLQNKGKAVTIYKVEVFAVDKEGTPTPLVAALKMTDDDKTIECLLDDTKDRDGKNRCTMFGSDMAQFEIQLDDADPKKSLTRSLTGYLEIDARESANREYVDSEIIEFTLTPKKESARLFCFLSTKYVTFGSVILASIVAAVLIFAAALWILNRKFPKKKCCKVIMEDIGIITWEPKENWLANIAGVASMVGGIFALTILPETTQFLAKTDEVNEFLALNVIFGLGVLFAPLAGNMLTTICPAQNTENGSRVWIYILVVSIIMWSTTGALITTFIFFDEIRAAGAIDSLDDFAMPMLQIILVIIWMVAVCYSVKKTVNSSYKNIVGKDQKKNIEEKINKIKNAKIKVGRAILELPSKSPIDTAVGLDFQNDALPTDLSGDPNDISVKSIYDDLKDQLKQCGDNNSGKKKAGAMLMASYNGLGGVLIALSPRADGENQPTSALPSAVTKMCQLFEEAAEKKSAARKTVQSIEVQAEVDKIRKYMKQKYPDEAKPRSTSVWEILEQGADTEVMERLWSSMPESTDKSIQVLQLVEPRVEQEIDLDFEPDTPTYVQPTPKVYLP